MTPHPHMTTLQAPVLNIPECSLQPGSSVTVTWDNTYDDDLALEQEWRVKSKGKAHRAPAKPQPPQAARREGICGPMGAILPRKQILGVPPKTEKTSTYKDARQKEKDYISTTGDFSPSSCYSSSEEEEVPAPEKVMTKDEDLGSDDGEEEACGGAVPRRRRHAQNLERIDASPIPHPQTSTP
ncbi:unnamed protein product [Merluccius merluccius]